MRKLMRKTPQNAPENGTGNIKSGLPRMNSMNLADDLGASGGNPGQKNF